MLINPQISRCFVIVSTLNPFGSAAFVYESPQPAVPSLLVHQALDGRIYEHVKDYLVSLCHTELEASQATHNTFQFLLDKSTRVSHV